jgi:formylglycine-generating enzyme required for sulfatase activity
MGDSFNEGDSDELPLHTVVLDSFALGKYEITNAQYCTFLNMTYPTQLKIVGDMVYASSDISSSYPFCDTSTSSGSQIAFMSNTFSVRNKGTRDMSNDPMVCVSWYGAVAYCNWRSQQEGKQLCYNLSSWTCDFTKNGYRLPTEAEWEYATRDELTDKRFPWDDMITHSQANYFSNSTYPYDISPTPGYHPSWNDGITPYTSPVGSFSANGYGLSDMAGNVWEWCNDWFGKYDSSTQTNPIGPVLGGLRVIRGGGWRGNSFLCRTANRGDGIPGTGYDHVGFRIELNCR